MVPFNIILFLSGFAALVYEVSWNRQLGLLLGHTSRAAAVVLAAYFGGMAIGYAVGGRIANRICPFHGYAACGLIEIVREGARRMLQSAIDAEVDAFIAVHSDRTDKRVRRLVVRKARLPKRESFVPRLPVVVFIDAKQAAR